MDSNGRCACITLEGRKPLLLSDGEPVVAWRKDLNGKRVGDKPEPISAKHHLTIVDDKIQLVPV